jgi:hypothetical protein
VARAGGGTASRRGREEKRHGVQERPEKVGGRELLPAVEHAVAAPSGGGRSRDGGGGREERIRRTGGERRGKVYFVHFGVHKGRR